MTDVTVLDGPSVGSPGHVLLLYRDERHRQARLLSWVEQGLARGEKVVYSTVADDPLLPSLSAGDVGSGSPLREGQLTVVPSEELFPGQRQAELVGQALEEGYPAVRLSARAEVALREARLEEYRAVDQLTDELCATQPLTALCQLAEGAADDDTLRTVLDSHSGGVEDAQMRLRRCDGELVLSGEVDFTSADLLARALGSLCRPDAAGRAVLDLSELTFIDVAGCRALALGTESLRRGGGTVVVRGAVGHLGKVLRMLRIDELAGMELA